MERLEEEVTQAVVIADNFNDNFAPLTDNLSPVSTFILKKNANLTKTQFSRPFFH